LGCRGGARAFRVDGCASNAGDSVDYLGAILRTVPSTRASTLYLVLCIETSVPLQERKRRCHSAPPSVFCLSTRVQSTEYQVLAFVPEYCSCVFSDHDVQQSSRHEHNF